MGTNQLMGIRKDGIVTTKLIYEALKNLNKYPSLYLGKGRLESYVDLPYGLKAGRAFNLDNGNICAVRARGSRVKKVGYLIELRGNVHFVYKPGLPGELGLAEHTFEKALTKEPVAA